ncbi:MAG: 3D domain-containing protein [Acidobacteriota bacterium]
MGAVLKKKSKYLSSCLSVMAIFAVSYPSSGEIYSAFASDEKTAKPAASAEPVPDEAANKKPVEDNSLTPTKPVTESAKPDSAKPETKSEEENFLEFQATAYCLKGRTASGEYVRPGIIAADPRVLPLGTVVHIKAGRHTGTYTVADTGGLIKGRKVDIYFPTRREAIQFGRQRVMIKVVGRSKNEKRNRATEPAATELLQ